MVAASTSTGTPYAALMITPSNGLCLQSNYYISQCFGSYTLPIWLRLSLSGDIVTAYTSVNGTTWTELGTATITLSNGADMGMFVTSHSSSTLSTATFDNVTVTSP